MGCVRMAKMQGVEDEGVGSVLKYMTKPESDSNAADWLLWHTALAFQQWYFSAININEHNRILQFSE